MVEEIRQDRVALVQHPAQFELCYAGCQLYAQFVQANFESSEEAVNGGFSYRKQGQLTVLPPCAVTSHPTP